MQEDEKDIKPMDKSKLPWIAAIAIFMQSLDATILNTALPSMAVDLQHSPLSMQSVIVAYTLTLALLIPVSGWLADKYGTKKIFTLAVFIFTLGSLACAASQTLGILVASRILQAIGGSMMVPVSRLTLIYAYPKNQLLRVINFVTMPGLIGPVIGPSLGGWLVDVASWHWIFLVNLPIGILGIIFAIRYMPNYTGDKRKFDTFGLLLFSGSLVVLSLSLELGSDGIINMDTFYTLLFGGLIFLLFYIWHATKISYPLIDLDLFKIRTLRIGMLGNIFTRLGVGGMPLLLPLLFQIGFSYSSTVSGLMLLPSALATVFAKWWVVPLVKRLGYKTILISNTLILAVVISMFALPEKTTPLFLFIPLLLIYGSVNSVQITAMNTISLADLNAENASGGNSLLIVTQQLSMSLGISVSSFVLRSVENATWLTHDNIQLAFKYTFLIMGLITLLTTGIFLSLKKDDGNGMSGRV